MIACYVVCNEADVIAESIRSVKAFVSRFVFIDSVFTANPIDATHSTDETRDVCLEMAYPVPVTYVESEVKLSQEQARNRYLDLVPAGEWIVNLDGDEVLYGDYFAILGIVGWLEASTLPAINVPILSAAVKNDGMAADVTPHEYRTAPLLHFVGSAPRFFRNERSLRYRSVLHVNGIVDNQGLYDRKELVASKSLLDSRLLIVNHHVRQSFAGYQADAVWELANDLVPV